MKQSSVWWQYCLPQRLLSRSLGILANCHCNWLKNRLIARFIRHFNVDLREADIQDYRDFANFNAFFTRHLKKGARKIAASAVISPVDGVVSAVGCVAQDQLFQAKGRTYSLRSLLGDDSNLAQQFVNGNFLTAYLAPKDYHRIHMPVTGRLLTMQYIPGRLFSVNNNTVNQVDRLFARNERVVCSFESEQGVFVMVAVGAMVVGSIATTWHGVVNAPRQHKPYIWNYHQQQIVLNKGDEMGYFQLGSTVIMLFQAQQINWQADLASNTPLRMGQAIV